MQERLAEIGAWLNVNGEAIYGTRPWRESSEGDVRYTSKGDIVYAIVEEWPGRDLALAAPQPPAGATVTLLGSDRPLKWHEAGGKMHVEVSDPSEPNGISLAQAYAFRLTGVK